MIGLIVRKATQSDLTDVLTWLKQEYKEESTGGAFWNNHDPIEEAQKRKELEVLVQPLDGTVLAFCVWSLHPVSMNIIEVRPEYRGKGFGRYLTQHVLDCLQKQGSIGVRVQCMPEASFMVWQKMGFQKINEEGCTGIHAIYLFRTTREFPRDVETTTIGIQLTNSGRTSGPPFSCQGMTRGAKCILRTDFVDYLPGPTRTSGHVLEIYVDGHLTYSGLVKYSAHIGVEVKGNFVRCRELDISCLTQIHDVTRKTR